MQLQYEDIYSIFYTKINDSQFFQLDETSAYEQMSIWLHNTVSLPIVRQCFSVVTFDDDLMELSYTLRNPVDDSSDEDFVKEMLAQGMVIGWMSPKVENAINLASVIGGKEEKVLQNNYKPNIERLRSLEIKLKKTVRDHGYFNGSYS